ncbi:MAG: hypothetical protein IPH20_01190 [Bacteroidales bacterium]|nr:hypothetical protein [Bacteroidales bacterium]
MSNNITFRKSAGPGLLMNNSLTAVFIDVLCLSGGKLAESDFQKEIMVRLAGMDASIRGSGFTGFDPEDLFNGIDPQEGSRFLQLVCENASAEPEWKGLSYNPDRKMLRDAIGRFSFILSEVGKISGNIVLMDFSKNSYFQCPVHGAYMHESGCVICNNS